MPDTVERAIYSLSVTGVEQLSQADQALGRMAATEERVTRATRTTTDGLERMIARLDARVRAEQQLQRALDQIARYEQEGIGSATRRAQAIGLVTERYNQQIAAVEKTTRVINDNNAALAQTVTLQSQINSRLGVRTEFGSAARAEDIAAYGRELDNLRAKFSPMFAAQQAYRTQLGDINQALRVGAINEAEHAAAVERTKTAFAGQVRELTGAAAAARTKAAADREAAAEAERLATAAQRAAAAQAEMIAQARSAQAAQNAQFGYNQLLGVNPRAGAGSAAASAAVFEDAFREQDRLAAAAQKYRDQLNPLLPLQRAYRAELASINEVAKAGLLTETQRTAAVQRAKDAFAGQVTTLRTVRDETVKATASAGQMRAGLVNIAQQAQDVVVSLQAGQNLTTVVLQQGTQIATVYATTPGILKAIGAAIGSWATPMTAAVAGVAALAGGIAVVLSRAVELERQVRTLGVTLRAMGTGGLASAGDLRRQVEQLRATGTPTAEGLAAVQEVIRTSGLNPAAAGAIAATGRDIGAILGGDIASGTKSLVSALSGGVEESIRFALSLNALGAEEANQARRMAELGLRGEALNLIFGRISATVSGSYQNSLSGSAKAMIELRDAWNRALDSLARSDVFQGLLQFLKGIAEEMERIIRNGPSFRGALVGSGTGALGGAVAGGAAGSVLGPWGTAAGVVVGGAAGAVTGWNLGGVIGSAPRSGVVATAPIPPIGGFQAGSAAAAAAEAASMVGLHENQDRAAIAAYLASGGANLDPATIAWCAAFANAALARQGIAGTGSNIATSFLNWGAAVSGEPMAGDIIVLPRGQGAGQTGGHVGFATGATTMGDAGLLYEMISGNRGNAVTRDFVSAADAVLRRAGVGAGGVDVTDPAAIARATQAIDEQVRARQQEVEVLRRQGLAADELRAAQEAERFNRERDIQGADAQRNILDAVAAARSRVAAETSRATAAAELEISNTREIAEAYGQSAQAGELMSQRAKAITEAYQRLGTVTSETAKQFISLRTQQLQTAEQFNLRQRFTEANVQDNQQIQVLRLQASLQGQTTEEINRQVGLLRVVLDAQAKGLDLTDKTVQARLKVVDAVGRENEAYAEAVRQQQRLEETFRSIASTIENSLTRALEDAFSGRRAQSWGERLKSILQSALSGLTTNLFIRPLIGTVAGGLGFANLASQYGSFGNLFGGGSSGSNVVVATPNGSGGFSLQTLSSGASLASSVSGGGLFGGGSGGLFGGVGNWLNTSVGPSLGFALPGAGPGGIPMASAPLFNTTFTGFLGGAGAGLGAGMLLNSLLGGNQLIGGIGSGIGGLAGAAIGSLFGGPLIGGLLGGALGGLFGLFGNTKPSNASAGGLIDLSTGRIGGAFTGGNAQIDSSTNAFVTQVASFTENLLRLTGGTLSGSLLLQGGVNTGFTADSTLPGYAGRYSLGKDPANAANIVMQAVAKSITDISDTMRKIIDSTSDLNQLAENLQFGAIYDNIATAAESAFANIPNEIQAGPFQQAGQQIIATFDAISKKAAEFGLALEPVNAALAEAQRRLASDYDRLIQDQILAISDSGRLIVEEEKRAGQARLQEAIAVNGNIAEVNRLNAMRLDAIWAQQTASLAQFTAELKTGSLSGLSVTAQLQAANDNYARSLALVQAGNLTEIANLTTYSQTAYGLSTQAYGYGPETIALRDQMIAALDAVLLGRTFAEGGVTPAGWSRVGEAGPEWIYSPTGGATVLPAGAMPPGPSMADLARVEALLAQAVSLLSVGNEINRVGFVESDRNDKQMLGEMRRPAITEPVRRSA